MTTDTSTATKELPAKLTEYLTTSQSDNKDLDFVRRFLGIDDCVKSIGLNEEIDFFTIITTLITSANEDAREFKINQFEMLIEDLHAATVGRNPSVPNDHRTLFNVYQYCRIKAERFITKCADMCNLILSKETNLYELLLSDIRIALDKHTEESTELESMETLKSISDTINNNIDIISRLEGEAATKVTQSPEYAEFQKFVDTVIKFNESKNSNMLELLTPFKEIVAQSTLHQ